jgi:hypothetical protein
LNLPRSLFSAALIVLLAAALAWGNCCTDFIPVQTSAHGCCDSEQAPTPAPMDCAGKVVDFAKALQPDDSKVPMVLADAGAAELPALIGCDSSEPLAAAVPLAVNCSRAATPLRI